jgi:SAM-dependent methyltransferase
MSEENTFENPTMAEEWIQAVESESNSSRAKEIYPFLGNWSRSLAPKILVEIGSGQGICSEHVETQGKYIGVEPSATLVKRAEALYAAPNRTFVVGNAYEIPLDHDSVDAVFSVGVWFHIENLDKVHEEVSKILKKGGELLIITSNPQTHDLWEASFENPSKQGKKIVGRVALPSGYMSKNIFYLHEEYEVVESLERNGLMVQSIEKLGQSHKRSELDDGKGFWSAIRAIKVSNNT